MLGKRIEKLVATGILNTQLRNLPVSNSPSSHYVSFALKKLLCVLFYFRQNKNLHVYLPIAFQKGWTKNLTFVVLFITLYPQVNTTYEDNS